MSAEYGRLTGRQGFQYVEQPTPTTERWVFGGGAVCTTEREAWQHMQALMNHARQFSESNGECDHPSGREPALYGQPCRLPLNEQGQCARMEDHVG